ncbi:hypothetical protein [Klebsiella quasipneumoniae]|uniref:hypothetical protein n=1 Tax=Klebsiella quasipneumoniae TaxID=1463165 RepID=UPI00128D86F6|nr:hypothetical protein [Klebsiella quasipneumoniae]QFU64967.1 hypothetical protein EQH50_09230 [Klebsiella quasipneumoniae]
MGQVINLTGAKFTDTRLPVMRNWSGLNDGSLLMLDMSAIDTDTSFTGAGTFNNLAANEAAALTGKTAAELSVSWTNNLTAAQAIFERTPKGGLHGIVSQVAGTAAGRAWFSCAGIQDYIAAHHSDHDFALFIHWRTTRGRKDSNSNPPTIQIAANSAPANNRFYYNVISDTLGTPSFAALANYKEGTITASAMFNECPLFGTPSALSGSANNCRSYVLYRLHLVDLTAAGMTLAEATAVEQGLYTSFFSAGGKYHNDTTPSQPSVLP